MREAPPSFDILAWNADATNLIFGLHAQFSDIIIDDASRQTGNWWEHWPAWTGQRSGNKIDTPEALGNKRYPELAPAPGTYIHN